MIIFKEKNTGLLATLPSSATGNTFSITCPTDVMDKFKLFCHEVHSIYLRSKSTVPPNDTINAPSVERHYENVIEKLLVNPIAPNFSLPNNAVFRLDASNNLISRGLHFSYVSEVCSIFSIWYMCQDIDSGANSVYKTLLEKHINEVPFMKEALDLDNATQTVNAFSLDSSFYRDDLSPIAMKDRLRDAVIDFITQINGTTVINGSKTFFNLFNIPTSETVDWLDKEIIEARVEYQASSSTNTGIDYFNSSPTSNHQRTKKKYLNLILMSFFDIIYDLKKAMILKYADCLYSFFYPDKKAYEINLFGLGEGSTTTGILDDYTTNGVTKNAYGQHFFSYKLIVGVTPEKRKNLELFKFHFSRCLSNNILNDYNLKDSITGKTISTSSLSSSNFRDELLLKHIAVLKEECGTNSTYFLRVRRRIVERKRIKPFYQDRNFSTLDITLANSDVFNVAYKDNFFIDNITRDTSNATSGTTLIHFYLFGTDFDDSPAINHVNIQIHYHTNLILELENEADASGQLTNTLVVVANNISSYSDLRKVSYDDSTYTLTIENDLTIANNWMFSDTDFKVSLKTGGTSSGYDEIGIVYAVLEGTKIEIKIDEGITYCPDEFNLFKEDPFPSNPHKCKNFTLYETFMGNVNDKLDTLCNLILLDIDLKFNSIAGFVGKRKDNVLSEYESKCESDTSYALDLATTVNTYTNETNISNEDVHALLRYSYGYIKASDTEVLINTEAYTDPVWSSLYNETGTRKSILDNYIHDNYFIQKPGTTFQHHSYNPVLSGLRCFSILEAICCKLIRTSLINANYTATEKNKIATDLKVKLQTHEVDIIGSTNKLSYSDYISLSIPAVATTSISDEISIIHNLRN